MNNINIFNGKLFMNSSVVNAHSIINISGIQVGSENLTEALYKRLLEAEREKVSILKAALNHEFPIEELVSDYLLTDDQANETTAMIETLSQKYELTHIFCFARKGTLSNNFSAFTEIPSCTDLHYFLLFVTKGTERVEHDIQDYINNHYKSFKVTAISHSFENVRNAIAQGNRFFIAAYLGGLDMYYDNVTTFDIKFPKLNQANTLEKAEKRFYDHIRMAAGFLNSASISIRNEKFFENGVFSLHQAVEQACIALIKTHMGYRIDLHNLARLLNLCKCFSDKPADLLLSDDSESARLFQILRDSYGNARYLEDFKIAESDAVKILEKVAAFVELAENLCLDWINNFRTKIRNEETEHNIQQQKD
ncbi:MAG: HEPN domain-containing protein [Panacibacter sp.]